MTDPTTLSPQQKLAKRIGEYVSVRDKMKEMEDRHKAELAPLQEIKDMLAGWLQQFMDTAGAESIKTENGTCHFNTRATASVADPSMFMAFVIDNKAFDLLDRRANSTAVQEYIKEHGAQPPGVNFSRIRTVGVRRPGAAKE